MHVTLTLISLFLSDNWSVTGVNPFAFNLYEMNQGMCQGGGTDIYIPTLLLSLGFVFEIPGEDKLPILLISIFLCNAQNFQLFSILFYALYLIVAIQSENE